MASSSLTKQNYSPNWSSGLPDELLEDISKKLLSPIDRTTFRSICETWRSSVQALRFSPLLMFPLDPIKDTLIFYSLSDKSKITLHLPETHNKVICGSSHGCLALMDETGGVSLLNPFTKFQIDLPPANEEIASASFNIVTKLNGRWMIKYDFDSVLYPLTNSELTEVFFEEIIFLSPPKYDGDDFVTVGILGSSTQIAFCKKEDSKWTLFETMLSCTIISIACYNDKIFVMDFIGDMSMCDIGNHKTATLLPNMNAPPETHRWKLVASEEGLFLVALVFDPNVVEDMLVLEYHTVVYRADFSIEEPSWCKVESIGNELTLFVSKSSNSNLLGRNISGCEGESIYFSGLLYNNNGEAANEVHSIEVVHLPDDSTKIVETCQGHQLQYIDAVSWFRPNLLLVKE